MTLCPDLIYRYYDKLQNKLDETQKVSCRMRFIVDPYHCGSCIVADS